MICARFTNEATAISRTSRDPNTAPGSQLWNNGVQTRRDHIHMIRKNKVDATLKAYPQFNDAEVVIILKYPFVILILLNVKIADEFKLLVQIETGHPFVQQDTKAWSSKIASFFKLEYCKYPILKN